MAYWSDDPPLAASTLGRKHQRQLSEWATAVAQAHNLGERVSITCEDELALIGVEGAHIVIAVPGAILDDRAFQPGILRALVAHELGEVATDPAVRGHAREYAADEFGASIVGASAMVRALRLIAPRAAGWGLLTRATASHPSFADRITHLRALQSD